MKVLLVDPPCSCFIEYDRWYYPLSLTQLAAELYEKGHDTWVYDADRYHHKDLATMDRREAIRRQSWYYDNVNNFDHKIWLHFIKTLNDINPDVVGVSVFTAKLQSCLNTLKIVKEYNHDIKTCVGGGHVTAVPDTFINNEYVDAVFVGPADNTFPKWIEDGCKQGIICGDPLNIDIKTLPYPRRKALLYPEFFTKRDLMLVSTGRGCVNNCSFCCNNLMTKSRSQFRTSDNIRAELKELIDDYGIDEILLCDASFSDIKLEVMRIAKVIKEFSLNWTCCCRFASTTKELVEFFRDCGCTLIALGVESGSDRMLKKIRKGTNSNEIRKKAKMLHSLGMKFQIHLITGFPEETEEDMDKTLELALEIKPTKICLNNFSPLPGTTDYNAIPCITPEIAASVNQLNPDRVFTKYIDEDTFKRKFDMMIRTFEDYNCQVKCEIV